MRPLRTLVLWSMPLALAALTGCGSPTNKPAVGSGPHVEMPKVAFVSNNPDPFWNIVENGCNKAAAESGVDIVFRKPPSGDPAAQQEVIDSLVNRDIKAISVSVIDPKNQTAYLNDVAKKVKLLAVDNDAPASDRICYIGTNNYAAGRTAGELVKEALPDGGTVVLFVGQTEALNARQRCQGVLDELAGAPKLPDPNNVPALPTGAGQFGKYKLHKIYTDQPEGQTKATQNASDALIQLKDDPNVCFVGLWAYNPPACLTALELAGKLGKVKVVGFDENPDTLKGVSEGNIFATVVQDPFGFGYESVKVMASLAKGETYTGAKVRDVPHRIVTQKGGTGRLTVDQYKAEEARKAGKTQR
jgi:ribose transport system substrate-binding protein